MTTSGSYDFSVDRDTISNAALRLCGVLDPEGGVASATQLSLCSEALNLMIKTWQAKGLYLWKRRTVSQALSASTAQYTLDTPRSLRVKDAYIRGASNNDTPLRIISREEYNRLGNKTSEGTPSQVWYDPQLAGGIVTVYPVPSDSLSTLYLEVEYPIEDFDTSVNTPDFPQEWFEALKFNLAVRIAPEYGVPEGKFKVLKALADESLALPATFDQEQASVYFGYSPY